METRTYIIGSILIFLATISTYIRIYRPKYYNIIFKVFGYPYRNAKTISELIPGITGVMIAFTIIYWVGK